MTIQEINKAYNRIIGSLDEKELKNAFDFLQGLIAGIREYSFQDRLNELQDTYKYMLRYRIEGAKDPMQDQIYNNLIASSYEFADIVKHKALSVDSPLSYYSRRRKGAYQLWPAPQGLEKRLFGEDRDSDRNHYGAAANRIRHDPIVQ